MLLLLSFKKGRNPSLVETLLSILFPSFSKVVCLICSEEDARLLLLLLDLKSRPGGRLEHLPDALLGLGLR